MWRLTCLTSVFAWHKKNEVVITNNNVRKTKANREEMCTLHCLQACFFFLTFFSRERVQEEEDDVYFVYPVFLLNEIFSFPFFFRLTTTYLYAILRHKQVYVSFLVGNKGIDRWDTFFTQPWMYIEEALGFYLVATYCVFTHCEGIPREGCCCCCCSSLIL